MQPPTLRLGDILVEQGAISRNALEGFAGIARGPIGHYLRSHDMICGRALARAIARQQGIRFLEFARKPADRSLFNPVDLPHYQQQRFIPYARGRTQLHIATPNPSEALRQFTQAHYRCPVQLHAISPRDYNSYFSTIAAEAGTRRARLTLRRLNPNLVADRILHPAQLRGLIGLLCGTIASFSLAPETSWWLLLMACNGFYLTTLAIKLQFYLQGTAAVAAQRATEPLIENAVRSIRDEALPVYSILVPMFHETEAVMGRLIEKLNALDYPREKLEIKLICEADDVATLLALKRLRPPQTMAIVRVPPSLPRTKPKACNFALPLLRGKFVVIFDAEDAPAPDQLKRAAVMFAAGGEKLACLQGALNYYNREENLLTKLFSIEYTALFRLLLPALDRMQLPIPLGGTSNHLRVSALKAVGGWDAFNVTEDADLGIRLSYHGYHTRILPSLTLEEAPITLGAWLKQRTRWIKGYIQTWLVFTRDSAELKRRLGGAGYYGFQFFVGAPALTFLLAPLFWAVFAFSLFGIFPTYLSPFMLSLCMISFVGGMVSHLLYARAAIRLEGWPRMQLALLAYPFYWLLHSLAAARALWQLATAPHYWEKTSHGLSRILKR